MDIKVFDRIEKKYIISNDQKKQLLRVIRKNMEKDNYFKSEVYNIYFDNKNFDTIINSIDWVDFKAKIRARYYGGYDYVYVEIKTKHRDGGENIGYKRRIKISLGEYKKFSNQVQPLSELVQERYHNPRDIQIAKEVDYLVTKNDLSPRILVMYDRENYSGKDGLRVTFDKNLRYRDQNLIFIPRKNDTMFFKDEPNIVLEVKARGSIPLWLVEAMSEQKIFPRQFSKIGNIYQRLNQKEGNNV